MEKKKKRRMILWLLFMILFVGGVAIVIGYPAENPPEPISEPKPEKVEAKQVMRKVFCYCSTEDVSHYNDIAEDMAKKQIEKTAKSSIATSYSNIQIGGIECLCGYYDENKDIAYISSIFTRGNFYDIPPCQDRLKWKYHYFDYDLKHGTVRFDLYSLNKPELYNQPIIFRIHQPVIYNDTSDTTLYTNKSGKEGYKFIKYTEVFRSITYHSREKSSRKALMVDQPNNSEDYGKISFEEYAEIAGVDLSKVVFVDIK